MKRIDVKRGILVLLVGAVHLAEVGTAGGARSWVEQTEQTRKLVPAPIVGSNMMRRLGRKPKVDHSDKGEKTDQVI